MESNPNKILIEAYQVPILDQAKRLSDFVPGIFHTIKSKKGLKNAIKKGFVNINGKRGYTADFIKGGELIELYRTINSDNKPSIEIDLEVLYEDEYLAVVNKPAGIVVSGNRKWTLENALSNNLLQSSHKDALNRPEPIHRLDYPTSGAILVGKTIEVVTALNKLFEHRGIQKYYNAVTIGKMEAHGVIDSPIESKMAKSEYSVLETIKSTKYRCLNLVELSPLTGRKHQLRIHMLENESPILGDLEHGIEGLILKGKGLFLHATSLHFIHPFTGKKLDVVSPLPKKFLKLFPKK